MIAAAYTDRAASLARNPLPENPCGVGRFVIFGTDKRAPRCPFMPGEHAAS